jgi:hypothetical protein
LHAIPAKHFYIFFFGANPAMHFNLYFLAKAKNKGFPLLSGLFGIVLLSIDSAAFNFCFYVNANHFISIIGFFKNLNPPNNILQ